MVRWVCLKSQDLVPKYDSFFFFLNGEHDDEIASEFLFFVFFDRHTIYIYIHTYMVLQFSWSNDTKE